MKEYTFGIVVLLSCLIHASCSSPLDIDTPRDRFLERKPITAARFFYNDGTSTGALFDEESWEGEITADAGRIWLRGTWTVPTARTGDIPVRKISIVLDSIPVDGTDIGIIDGVAGNGGNIAVNLPPFTDDQLFFTDGSSTTLTLRLVHDPANRRIDATAISLVATMRSFSFEGRFEIEY